MRIEALELPAFGALSGQRFELGPGISVVQGPNEAGKSTFHTALETVLFGFEESRRDAHPLVAWDPEGPDPCLQARVRSEAGESLWIQRELRRSAGVLWRATQQDQLDSGTRLSNDPLTEIQAVSRALFRAVYSLTANGAVELKDNVREQVDTLLSGELGLAGARPLYAVRADLRAEAKALWQPSRHATEASRIKTRIGELRKIQRAAMAADRLRREESQELFAIDCQRNALRAEINQAERQLAGAEFQAEVCELEAKRSTLIDLESAALEGTQLGDPSALAQEVRESKAALAAPNARLAREARQLSPSQLALLDHAGEVALVQDQLHEARRDREHVSDALEQERFDQLTARRALLDVGLEELDQLDLDPLPLGSWSASAMAWQDADAEARAEMSAAPREGQPMMAILSAAAGLALVGLGLAQVLPTASIWAGSSILALSVGIALVGGRPRADDPRFRAPHPGALEEACKALHAETSDHAEPHQLLRLLEAAQCARDARDSAAGHGLRASNGADRERARRMQWIGLAEELLGETTPTEQLDSIPGRLSAALEQSRAQAQAVDRDQAERAGQRALLDERQPRYDSAQRRLNQARDALHATFGESLPLELAYTQWRAQLDLRTYLRQHEERLREHPLWNAPQVAPAGELFEVSAEAQAAHIADLRMRYDECGQRQGSLKERQAAQAGPSQATAEEELRLAQTEHQNVRQRRDRLALLENILNYAERSYRREHQPDVLKRAGQYLSAITSGRYTTLAYPDGDQGSLHVYSAARGIEVPVNQPLSRGIQEQIYLCLRLGTLDHLDAGREPLPLILDEALVHWDPQRRAALYPVLAEMASRRQVILFSCHPEFAREAQVAMDATRIDLTGG